MRAEPNPPGEECDDSPGAKPGREGANGLASTTRANATAKASIPRLPSASAGGIERGGLPAPPVAGHPGLSLARRSCD